MSLLHELLANQYGAALRMVHQCIERCPDATWNAPVGELKFCQVAFHTLFFADYYLCPNEDAVKDQAFHQANVEHFRDYEELEPREQVLLYERSFLTAYAKHCRDHSAIALSCETDEMLAGPSGFKRRTFSRAELHVYNIRHIQHHAAQLSLRLRLNTGDGIEWVGSGWEA